MQLLETIRVENGEFSNLISHQNRMNNARKELFFCTDEIDLALIFNVLPNHISNNELYKCRIIYDTEIIKVEYIRYKIPFINSLQLVNCDEIEYRHKYLDRQQINELFSKKGKADDIIIIRNGHITDSSTANLLFYNGKEWLTPAFPLLKGTQRAKLLDKEIIKVADIRPEDLYNFSKARLINAMLKFEDKIDVKIKNVYQ
jgi:4-amino-4-deoxychorismate lyase